MAFLVAAAFCCGVLGSVCPFGKVNFFLEAILSSGRYGLRAGGISGRSVQHIGSSGAKKRVPGSVFGVPFLKLPLSLDCTHVTHYAKIPAKFSVITGNHTAWYHK